jgi:hypothetical protein
MPVPFASAAIVEPAKVRDYLLNLEHPDGGSKAAWFRSLGYTRDDWQQLAGDLLGIAQECGSFATERTRFGVKYLAKGKLGRSKSRSGSVLTVWIVEGDDPPRLVTAYPDEES